MMAIVNLANRDLDPSTEDEVRRIYEFRHLFTLWFIRLSQSILVPPFGRSLFSMDAGEFFQYLKHNVYLWHAIVFRAKDHVVKSAAGHFALKRLINQDKGRLQSENKGKSVGMCVGDWQIRA